jgi:dTDP-4-amino-4,6-dideoxygalactose transaminase
MSTADAGAVGTPPAILGGAPRFPRGLPLARPTVADHAGVTEAVARILSSGVLTDGPYVRRLEERAARYLGVRQCVAVSSCTAGLMLLLRATDLSGDVVVPAFTFAATAHALAWNNLRPTFCDVDPATLTADPRAVVGAIGARSSAILATHTYGTPCDVEGLTDVAARAGVRLYFDAAHAFGSRHGGRAVGGFGDAEVFSLSPTKPLIAGEGGIIATDDDVLAERCRIGRNYGNPGDYDCLFVGLNARMSEFHAAVALASLEDIEDRIQRRIALAAAYRDALADVEGITFPRVPVGDRSTFKDLTILVEEETFGLDAAHLGRALAAEGIETRRYYSPPLHRMRAYSAHPGAARELPVTDHAAARVVTLPLWCDMTRHHIDGVADAMRNIQVFLRDRQSLARWHPPIPGDSA